MKAKPLALAIAQLTTGQPRYLVQAAQVESLYKPGAGLEVCRERIDSRFVVEWVKVAGELIELWPALPIVDGMSRRTFDTDGFTHVFSVCADFEKALIVGKLQSFCHGSHEYVYLEGEWAPTVYHTNATRRIRS